MTFAAAWPATSVATRRTAACSSATRSSIDVFAQPLEQAGVLGGLAIAFLMRRALVIEQALHPHRQGRHAGHAAQQAGFLGAVKTYKPPRGNGGSTTICVELRLMLIGVSTGRGP
jgi:hypothetical protein